MRVFSTLDDVARAVGEDLGTSDWLELDQKRVDAFADATGDHQWIHTDPARAAHGPFGGTVAHGYLTLSLVPFLAGQVFRMETPGPTLNYGLNKVRFPHPLKVGARVRSHVSLLEAVQMSAGLQLVLKHVLEVEDEEKPACVAEAVLLLMP